MDLNDEGFKVPSPRAAEALPMAEELMACAKIKHTTNYSYTVSTVAGVSAVKTCLSVPSRTAR